MEASDILFSYRVNHLYISHGVFCIYIIANEINEDVAILQRAGMFSVILSTVILL